MTKIRCTPKLPQSVFVGNIATAAGVNQATVGSLTSDRHRVKQGVAPTRCQFAADLMNVGGVNIVISI